MLIHITSGKGLAVDCLQGGVVTTVDAGVSDVLPAADIKMNRCYRSLKISTEKKTSTSPISSFPIPSDHFTFTDQI